MLATRTNFATTRFLVQIDSTISWLVATQIFAAEKDFRNFAFCVARSMSDSKSPDSPAFLASFDRWRIAITSMTARPDPLQCEGEQKWEAGKIMQPPPGTAVVGEGDKTAEVLKREAKECSMCEKWRDELIRESTFSRPARQLATHCAPPRTTIDDVQGEADSLTPRRPDCTLHAAACRSPPASRLRPRPSRDRSAVPPPSHHLSTLSRDPCGRLFAVARNPPLSKSLHESTTYGGCALA